MLLTQIALFDTKNGVLQDIWDELQATGDELQDFIGDDFQAGGDKDKLEAKTNPGEICLTNVYY